MNKCTCGRCPTTRIERGLPCFATIPATPSTGASRRVSCEMPVPRFSFMRKQFIGISGKQQ